MDQSKRRTFKKFQYKGISLEELTSLSLPQLLPLLPSNLRRHLKRGLSQQELDLINKKTNEIRNRNFFVLPCFFYQNLRIYNGCQYVELEIKPEMMARRFKDLVPTKMSKAHGKPGVGATSGSKFVPLK